MAKIMDLKEYKIVDITDPQAGRVIIKNSYWCCINGDPKQALFYKTSPQCNRNESISKSVAERLHRPEDNIKVVFVETAFALRRD